MFLILCFIQTFVAAQPLARKLGFGWRELVVLLSVLFGATLVCVTELLSQFSFITSGTVSFFWGAVALACIYLTLKSIAAKDPWLQAKPEKETSRFNQFLFWLVVICLLPSLFVAVYSPPNNGDGFVYHIARVMHWEQNCSVRHYPTTILRQIQLGPMAEFVFLHLHLLANGDQCDNLVQWGAMLGSVICASLAAEKLGADRRGQLLAALFAVTIPMGILQSSSTQNDYVAAYWLLCTAYFVLAYAREPDENTGSVATRKNIYTFMAGAALGLELLTKGTGFIYSPAIVLWALYTRKIRLQRDWKRLLAVAALVVALNLGHCWRNTAAFGIPLGSLDGKGLSVATEIGEPSLTNEIHTPNALISNMIRNLIIHGQESFNLSLHRYVMDFYFWSHDLIGIHPLDLRTTWGYYFIYGFDWKKWQEDKSGNPLHLILIFVALCFFLSKGRKSENREAADYFGCLLLAFMLFSLLLKVQVYHGRLHLSLFVFAAPVVGLCLGRIGKAWMLACVAALLVALAVPVHLYNNRRPLLGPESILTHSRKDNYFAGTQIEYGVFDELKRKVAEEKPENIGLFVPVYEMEYIYWLYLPKNTIGYKRMQHIMVDNPLGKLEKVPPWNNFSPDIVLVLEPPEKNVSRVFNEKLYDFVWSREWISLYRKSKSGKSGHQTGDKP
jgi:hypothetical protein